MIKLMDPRESTIYGKNIGKKYNSKLLPNVQAPTVKRPAHTKTRGSEVVVVLVFLSSLATISLGIFLLI